MVPKAGTSSSQRVRASASGPVSQVRYVRSSASAALAPEVAAAGRRAVGAADLAAVLAALALALAVRLVLALKRLAELALGLVETGVLGLRGRCRRLLGRLVVLGRLPVCRGTLGRGRLRRGGLRLGGFRRRLRGALLRALR